MHSYKQHWSIITDHNSNKGELLLRLKNKKFPNSLKFLSSLNGIIFSKDTIDFFIEKEEKHHIKILNKNSSQSLKSLSSGEQKIALLNHILNESFEYIILDDAFENLDTLNYANLKNTISQIAVSICIIQITSRKSDVLPFITTNVKLKNDELIACSNLIETKTYYFEGVIPKSIVARNKSFLKLVHFNKVSVSYFDTPILNSIDWKINEGEFWQLVGENGSGKSTLISLITADNPKAYGQNLTLFDKLRGSGETIWEIKKNIGYFTPSMIYNFKGHHSVLNMVISGIRDSIGLYQKPSEIEVSKALEWLSLIKLEHLKNDNFKDLNKLNQRLIMLVRAFIKWPYLLILDEPTVDLDDENAYLFTTLLNKFHTESSTAIIYVSHRNEKGIKPQKTLQLTKTVTGSIANIH